MSGSNLQSLERDVELARDRFAHDLARLRSPETISEFKDTLWAEARETKDELIEKTKDAAQDGIQRIIADLKERAAANPAAVLAIGAGLAWRLIHRPPIASLLVGIGLVGLFRPQTGGEVVAGASKLLHSAKDTVQEWSEDLRQASSDGMSEIADRATRRSRPDLRHGPRDGDADHRQGELRRRSSFRRGTGEPGSDRGDRCLRGGSRFLHHP